MTARDIRRNFPTLAYDMDLHLQEQTKDDFMIDLAAMMNTSVAVSICIVSDLY